MRKKRILKILTSTILILICVIIFFNPEFIIQMFFRNHYFRKYIKNNQQIYFLGTDHSMSLDTEPFSYLELKSVIENLKPDLVLIESRPEQLDNSNWADGPPKMLYCHLIANRLAIRVKGVDWWTVSSYNIPNSSNPIRDSYIHENIVKNINLYKSKKILIIMGADHVILEQPKLESVGYKEAFFSVFEKNRLFKIHNKRLTYPKGMTYYIKKRIDYEKNCIGTIYKTNIWKNQALYLIKDLNREITMIEKAGEF
ncbi:hypothetical protein ACJDU8_20820 [Clostridium sp. WILCCON 0269]|uniref:Haem-binding uptake Tiki superfamily ChaN domain-containing protein n=1 Tax=Candidatus Clostridium eludens TaxID=3381663 RepID=A0ABW8SU02_9CLOT